MTELCRQLDWDSQFFGRRIARIERDRLDAQSLNQALTWCGEQGIECLYFLCSPEDDGSVALVEATGFHLVDIRVELNWKAQQPTASPTFAVREFQEADLVELQRIASQAYANTRFSYDNRFPADRVAELYKEWLTGSCRNPSHKVFVVAIESTIAGFITCQFDNTDVGRVGLLGLSDNAQGKGYGLQLVQTAQQFFSRSGVRQVRVVTQGRNIAAQRLYQSCDFRICKVGLWYHKWFE